MAEGGLSLPDWLKRVEHKLDKAIADHESRLRLIERIMWVALGLAIAGGAGGASALLG